MFLQQRKRTSRLSSNSTTCHRSSMRGRGRAATQPWPTSRTTPPCCSTDAGTDAGECTARPPPEPAPLPCPDASTLSMPTRRRFAARPTTLGVPDAGAECVRRSGGVAHEAPLPRPPAPGRTRASEPRESAREAAALGVGIAKPGDSVAATERADSMNSSTFNARAFEDSFSAVLVPVETKRTGPNEAARPSNPPQRQTGHEPVLVRENAATVDGLGASSPCLARVRVADVHTLET